MFDLKIMSDNQPFKNETVLVAEISVLLANDERTTLGTGGRQCKTTRIGSARVQCLHSNNQGQSPCRAVYIPFGADKHKIFRYRTSTTVLSGVVDYN